MSYLGPAAAALLTGSVVVETIFGMPGVGRYFVEARAEPRLHAGHGHGGGRRRLRALFNLVVDILYAVVDPRVRYD